MLNWLAPFTKIERPRPVPSFEVGYVPFRSKRKTRLHARRAVLLALGTFILIQVLLFGLMHRFPQLRDPQFGDKFKQMQAMIAHSPQPSEVLLALGSSRTGMGFRGDLVSKAVSQPGKRPVLAFNFGIPAVGPVLQLTYLKRFLAKGFRPNVLLLEVHPALLSSQNGNPIEKRGLNLEQLNFSEIESIQQRGYLPASAKLDWALAQTVPSAESRFVLLGRLLPNWLSPGTRFDWGRKTDPWGWNACVWSNPPESQRQQGIESARKEYEEVLRELRFDTAPVDALRELLALARQEKIAVKLILMPEGAIFRSWYPPEVEARLQELLRSLNTPLIDARSWVAEEDFLDSHHLLKSGATLFSERLGKELSYQQD
jgi:hypothetical protein